MNKYYLNVPSSTAWDEWDTSPIDIHKLKSALSELDEYKDGVPPMVHCMSPMEAVAKMTVMFRQAWGSFDWVQKSTIPIPGTDEVFNSTVDISRLLHERRNRWGSLFGAHMIFLVKFIPPLQRWWYSTGTTEGMRQNHRLLLHEYVSHWARWSTEAPDLWSYMKQNDAAVSWWPAPRRVVTIRYVDTFPLACTRFGFCEKSTKAEQESIHRKWQNIMRNSYMVIPATNVVFVVDRPVAYRFEDELLSCEDAPAVEFRDGIGIWAYKGMMLPKKTLVNTTARKILNTRNVEARRVLLERYNMTSFLRELNAEQIHSDGFGDLYKLPSWARFAGEDEDVHLVQVVNATPEPDGSYKDYILRVSPDHKTAHEAIASTFRVDAKQYNLVGET